MYCEAILNTIHTHPYTYIYYIYMMHKIIQKKNRKLYNHYRRKVFVFQNMSRFFRFNVFPENENLSIELKYKVLYVYIV